MTSAVDGTRNPPQAEMLFRLGKRPVFFRRVNRSYNANKQKEY